MAGTPGYYQVLYSTFDFSGVHHQYGHYLNDSDFGANPYDWRIECTRHEEMGPKKNISALCSYHHQLEPSHWKHHRIFTDPYPTSF